MEQQLHRTGHHYDVDEHLHPSGTDVHDEYEHGGETKSAMKKVKEKVEKMKATIKHGHGHEDDDTKTVNDSAPVRSGMVQPTVMGTPVLAEDLYATHSDIVDPPVRTFAQWEEEERHGAPPPLPTTYGAHLTDLPPVGHHDYIDRDVNREQLRGSIGTSTGMEEDLTAPNLTTTVSPTSLYVTHSNIVDTQVRTSVQGEEEDRHGAPPPLPTAYGGHPTDLSEVGHHDYSDQDVNREQLRGSIGKSTGMEEDPSAPNLTTTVSPANYQTKVTDPTDTGGKEAGITEVLKSFDKMGIYDESYSKSSDQNEPELYTGSHDQFAPAKPVENPPLDTIAADPSHPNSSYAQKISSATSAIANTATAAKDTIASKLGFAGENKSETSSTESNKTNKNSSFSTDFTHKVADTMTGTFVPVYEKVVGAKSAVMSKIQGSGHGHDVDSRIPSQESKKVTVREYLVETFRPGDEDKVLSEKITNVFHRGKGNTPQETSTTYVIDDHEGERRLQESSN